MFFAKFINHIFLILILIFSTSCGIYKPVDARKTSTNVNERVKKNIQEGKGFKVFDNNRKNGGFGNFEFASSNPMWRASVKLLDFTPFSNVDYSGGIIITDWFNDDQENSNEYIKITVKFLSNEIRSDGLDVLIYKKTCKSDNNCNVAKVDTGLAQDIKLAILKEASILKEIDDSKLVDPDFKLPREGKDIGFGD